MREEGEGAQIGMPSKLIWFGEGAGDDTQVKYR